MTKRLTPEEQEDLIALATMADWAAGEATRLGDDFSAYCFEMARIAVVEEIAARGGRLPAHLRRHTVAA